MKKIPIQLFIFSAVVFLQTSCKENETRNEYVKISEAEQIKEGKRLITAYGCNDCHSPKKITPHGPIPDERLLLSGYNNANYKISSVGSELLKSGNWILFSLDGTVAMGPWGTSFSANLTPDETGLGTWTRQQFATAMREGKYKGLKNGRALLPPMPTLGYKELKNDEIAAMFSYLQSIKPIENVVPLPPK